MTNKIDLNAFADAAISYINCLEEKQLDNIKKASDVLSASIAAGGVIQVFGSGHSWGFGIELSKKAGTLVPVHVIQTSDFVTKGLVSLEEFKDKVNIFERKPNMANRLYDLYDIRTEDAFIIISNSGINGLVIDMAIKAREKNHPVIVITSMEHTLAEDSRHPSGKKLYQLGDIVIDNCGPQGDAILESGDLGKVCSISSITGGVIAHLLTENITQNLLENNQEIPVLRYPNDEDAEKINSDLFKKYEGRV